VDKGRELAEMAAREYPRWGEDTLKWYEHLVDRNPFRGMDKVTDRFLLDPVRVVEQLEAAESAKLPENFSSPDGRTDDTADPATQPTENRLAGSVTQNDAEPRPSDVAGDRGRAVVWYVLAGIAGGLVVLALILLRRRAVKARPA